jgi:DNA polymerase III subunit epsilon
LPSRKYTPLQDVPFYVVDLETTGSTPKSAEILEIGVVKMINGEVVATFDELVQPEGEVPPYISKITGITPAMVKNAPLIDAVFFAFKHFVGDGLLVAHNAPFDISFIGGVHESLYQMPLENPHLCTLKLARRLLPKEMKKGLETLAEFYELTNIARHRALGDALVTAEVLKRLLIDLEEKHQVETLEGLFAFDMLKTPQIKRGGMLPYHALKEHDYPTTPGVYQMKDLHGNILYIGKAKNLRNRIRSYFRNPKGQPRKVIELMSVMEQIEWQPLGSELEALLTEAKLIKEHQPIFNRQIKHFQHLPFIQIDWQEDYPKIEVTPNLDNEAAIYYGPFHHKSWVAETLENVGKQFRLRSCSDTVFKQHQFAPCLEYGLGQCSGPCAGLIPQETYRADVQDLMDYLEGKGDHVITRLESKREQHSERLEYEKAQRTHEQIDRLNKLKRRTNLLSQAVHQTHCLILLPSHLHGHITAILVLNGVMQDLTHVPYHQEGLRDWLYNIPVLPVKSTREKSRTTFIPKSHFEETRLLMQWLRTRLEPLHSETESETESDKAKAKTKKNSNSPLSELLLPNLLPAAHAPEELAYPEGFDEQGWVLPISLPFDAETVWQTLQQKLCQPFQTSLTLS